MRQAFTMIELIFVIVILGVLAAVAIPKLSATRDDAKVSKTAHVIATASTEIQSFAMAKGVVTNDLSLMSSQIKSSVMEGEATLNILSSLVDFKMANTNNCITLRVISGTNDVNLSLVFGPSGDSICDSLQSMFDTSINLIPLKGNYVRR